MSEIQTNDESKKTLVAFVVGLLIGGMLVWAFSGPTTTPSTDMKKDEEPTVNVEVETQAEDTSDTQTEAPKLQVGEGAVTVVDQAASMSVKIDSATYPVSEGWIGVRQYTDGKLGLINGVVRFSEAQGLVPSEIILQSPTVAGREYAVVIFSEDGDRTFNLAGDVQLDQIYATFKAQ